MKLVCAQDALSAKLALLSRIVPSNPSHPVLANVLLQAMEGRLGLTVFDLSVGMQVWMSAQVEGEGSLTVPARFLNDIVSRLPNQEVEIETTDSSVTLACGTGQYQMQGLPADEFPALPNLEEAGPVQLEAATLLDGLQTTLFAASTDESKQILTGLHFKARERDLEFATTDGHRLAITRCVDTPVSSEICITIPAKALRELERMLTRHPTTVTMRSDSAQVVFDCATEQGVERLSCRLLEGQYPAYEQLVPREFIRAMSVERQLLISSVDRIAVLAARKNNIIRLKLDPVHDRLAISAEAPEFGSGEEYIPAQITGDPLEIAFNAKYLSDGLKAMNSTEIQVQMNSETMPAVLTPLSGPKMTYLIMPIQIRS
ncbi:DNA polymerase III subunit beta [Lyngbya confervoides]|uniref:Beta sliding clamp n=1 Tax=Lyngbya confervoides BDU141951 TaxID=1574623 RepID=A0ABD4T8Y4_9CYAN|nr:DNA polymerase III subunit beta [Lyngbya confervoides]MCM1984785.1 DNA polymerase III subunit beta [Lyngbya confervoides BDU141951]